MSRTVKSRKFKLLYFRNETCYGNGNLYKDLIFDYLQPIVNKNSYNLAILTLQFDDVTVKTIYCLSRFIPFYFFKIHYYCYSWNCQQNYFLRWSFKVSATLQDSPRADRYSVSCFYKNPYKPYIS